MELWSLGVLLIGAGIFIYCVVTSIFSGLNAVANMQAVDILEQMQQHIHTHDVDPEDNDRPKYNPD